MLSADLNDQICINIDTLKLFLERLNRESESSNHETTPSAHATSSATRTQHAPTKF